MKKLALVVLLLLLALGTVPLLASCETAAFGSSLTFVAEMPPATENQRYIVWEGRLQTVLVDKETRAVYPLCYEKNTATDSRPACDYAYTVKYVLNDTAIEWHTHLAVPTYNSVTGTVDHYLYYPTVIRFDYTGQETGREESNSALSEEEVTALLAEQVIAVSTRFYYAEEVGSGRGRYEPETTGTADGSAESPYTALQQKAVDYALALQPTKRGEYHYTYGQGFEQDGKLYFSVTRSNQKGWASQSATVRGIYHNAVLCYDSAADTYEILFESDKTQEILLFDTEHALVLKGNTILSYAFETGKSQRVCKLEKDAYYTFECSDGILHLSRLETIRGTPKDTAGYARFSYPCDLHTFVTPDGTVIAEDYDLTPSEKEAVTNAKDVTYQD